MNHTAYTLIMSKQWGSHLVPLEAWMSERVILILVSPWNSKQPVFYGCFNWMIPNHYIKNGCFTKHPLKNGCLGYQVSLLYSGFSLCFHWVFPNFGDDWMTDTGPNHPQARSENAHPVWRRFGGFFWALFVG